MRDESRRHAADTSLLAALRRSVVIITLVTLVGIALGVGVGLQRAQEFTARSTVLVAPLSGNPFNPNGQGDDLVNLETEAQLVGSDAVANVVAGHLNGRMTAAELRSGLSVSVPPNTQILSIEYTTTDGAAARRRAQGFADAYLDFRKQRAEALTSSSTRNIQAQIDRQGSQLADLLAKLNQEQDVTDRALLRQQVDGVTTQIAQLRSQLADLNTGGLDPGQVITPATLVSPSPLVSLLMYAGLGLLGGLLLAAAIVVVRARAENRIHRVDDVGVAGLPLLGTVGMGEVRELTTAATSWGEVAATAGPEHQNLRVAFLARERRRPVRVLYAPAATLTGHGRCALSLAYTFALSDLTTVLVDASGEPHGITDQLELTGHPGFFELLSGEIDIDVAVTRVNERLHVLPAGKADPHVKDLLTSPRLPEVVGRLEHKADIVMVVTGPVHSPEALAVAMATDCLVVEALEGETRVKDLLAVAEDPVQGDMVAGVVYVRRQRSGIRSKGRRR